MYMAKGKKIEQIFIWVNLYKIAKKAVIFKI